ncbi:MAG: hypothetical protein WC607_04835 [Candidatus Micrarchaeia archaeon]
MTGYTPKYCYAVPCSGQGSGDGSCLTGPSGEYATKVGAYSCGFDWNAQKTKYCYEEQSCTELGYPKAQCLLESEGYNAGKQKAGNENCGAGKYCYVSPCSLSANCGEALSNFCICQERDDWSQYDGECSLKEWSFPCSAVTNARCVHPEVIPGWWASEDDARCTLSEMSVSTESFTGAETVEVTVDYAGFDIASFSEVPHLEVYCDYEAHSELSTVYNVNKGAGSKTVNCVYPASSVDREYLIRVELSQNLKFGDPTDLNTGFEITTATVTQHASGGSSANCPWATSSGFDSYCVGDGYTVPSSGCSIMSNDGCRDNTKCIKAVENDFGLCVALTAASSSSYASDGDLTVNVNAVYNGLDVDTESNGPTLWYRCDAGDAYTAYGSGSKNGGSFSVSCVYDSISSGSVAHTLRVKVKQENVGEDDVTIERGYDLSVTQTPQSGGSPDYPDCAELHPQWGDWLPCITRTHVWANKYFEFNPSVECAAGKYCFEPKSCVDQNLKNAACLVPGQQPATYTKQGVKACDIADGGDYPGELDPDLYYAAYCYEQTSAPITGNSWVSCDEQFPEETVGADTICLNPLDSQAKYYYPLNGGVECGSDKYCYYTQSCFEQGYSGNVCAVPGEQPQGYQKHSKACDLVDGGLIGLDPNTDYRAYCWYQGTVVVPENSNALVSGVFISSPADLKSAYTTNGVLDLELRVFPFWKTGSAYLKCKYDLKEYLFEGAEAEHSTGAFVLFHDGSGLEVYPRPAELTGLRNSWYGLELSCMAKPEGIIENVLSAIPFFGDSLVYKPVSTTRSFFYHARNTVAVGAVCTDPAGC